MHTCMRKQCNPPSVVHLSSEQRAYRGVNQWYRCPSIQPPPRPISIHVQSQAPPANSTAACKLSTSQSHSSRILIYLPLSITSAYGIQPSPGPESAPHHTTTQCVEPLLCISQYDACLATWLERNKSNLGVLI
jgi:hypothetical protein